MRHILLSALVVSAMLLSGSSQTVEASHRSTFNRSARTYHRAYSRASRTVNRYQSRPTRYSSFRRGRYSPPVYNRYGYGNNHRYSNNFGYGGIYVGGPRAGFYYSF
ncbi:MAG: hypothetical protein WAO83_23540 [Fuerstiella sp.]